MSTTVRRGCGKAYIAKRRAEGKRDNEIHRSIKSYIARGLYRFPGWPGAPQARRTRAAT